MSNTQKRILYPPKEVAALPKYNLPDMNVISLSMIQRAAKYKCNCRYLPKRWCNLIVTSRAWSNTTSGMYENCTGSPIYWRPPMLKKTLACTKTYGREGERRNKKRKGHESGSGKRQVISFPLFFRFFRVKQVPKVMFVWRDGWMNSCPTVWHGYVLWNLFGSREAGNLSCINN